MCTTNNHRISINGKRNMNYEDKDLTDAVGELIRSKKTRPLKKILWINVIVVGIISLILLAIKWKIAS
jgi:hypothetical protein